MSDKSTPRTKSAAAESSRIRNWLRVLRSRSPSITTPRVAHGLLLLAFFTLASTPAAAQSGLGSTWCGTGVDTGITIVFGALAGLGLPATAIFMGLAGFSYVQAGGNPQKKNDAKERLVLSGIGFAIIALAVLSPTIINNIGSQMGFGFAQCMTPF